jgi:hypothetical protein
MLRWIFGGGDLVFRFHDGVRRRRLDPLAAWSRLEEVGGADWIQSFRPFAIDSGGLDKEAAVRLGQGRALAVSSLATVARRAFEIPPFDQGGRTDEGCFRVLCDYVQSLLALEVEFRPLFDWSEPAPSSYPLPTDEDCSPLPSPSESEGSEESPVPPEPNAEEPRS